METKVSKEMIEPYYQEDGITLYCARAEDVLPQITERVDLVLTDPPYGIDLTYEGCNTRNEGREIMGDDKPFDPSLLLKFPRLIIFGANNFADKLPRGGWIVWDKRIRNDKSDLANQCDGELAWTNITNRILIFRHLWIGAFRASEGGEQAVHPSQKPIALMEWCIEKFTESGQLIVDGYLGSGTTLVAAKHLGRRAIGIEMSEKYCKIAVNRLQQKELFGIVN